MRLQVKNRARTIKVFYFHVYLKIVKSEKSFPRSRFCKGDKYYSCSSIITEEFLPLCLMVFSFVSCLYLFTQQCTVWTDWTDSSIFHHQSNPTKTFTCPVNNPIANRFFFAHVQVLIPLSWNFDFLFDPWTSAAIASLTQPLLDSVSFLT